MLFDLRGEILIYFWIFFLFLHFFFFQPPVTALSDSKKSKKEAVKICQTLGAFEVNCLFWASDTKKKKNAVAKLQIPGGGRVEWPAKSNFSVCVFTRVAIAGGKCIVSAPGSSLCYGSSVTHYSVAWCALCKAAKKINKESQDYSMARWEITYFTPGSHITADYRARTRRKVVLNNADIRQSECLFDDRPGKQLTQRYSIEVNS